MENYPAPARALVAQMTAAAIADPARGVAFQGAPGANSQIAVAEAFPDGLAMPCFSFEDAIDAVRDGIVDRAMIPIENSLHGRVADIHFLLPESGLSIIGEHFLRIRHCLMGRKGGRIVEAMSHPQALGQCRHWLRAEGIKPIGLSRYGGRCGAVAELGRDDVAALAPAMAAELYGLDMLAENIADSDDNTTRFVVLARDPLSDFPEGPR